MSDFPLASLFMVGVSGPTLAEEDKQVLSRGVGGVVLFSRNVQTPEQVASLVKAARGYAGDDLLVSVDQEGGRVARLVQGFTQLPSMRELGRACRDAKSTELAIEVGKSLGSELCEVGIDIDLAPVLDVDTNPDNPVIGDRSIGSDPPFVADVGLAIIKGLLSQGVVACGKHFPGHGDTQHDSHWELPRLSHSWQRIQQIELLPFQSVIDRVQADPELKRGLAIMSAHVVFDAIDSHLPATLCRAVMTDLLATSMGFEGLRLTDCLEMKAISDGSAWGGTVGAAVKALQAGIDLVLVSHSHDRMHASIDAVETAFDQGQLDRTRIEDAQRRRAATIAFRKKTPLASAAFHPTANFQSFVEEGRGGGIDPTWEEKKA